MAKRRKEPWEEESQPAGGGGGENGNTSSSSSPTTGESSGGGLKIPSSGNRDYSSNKPSPIASTSQPPVAATENSTTQYSGDGVQQSTQVEPVTTQAQAEAKATSGNSAGHLSTIKTNYTKGAEAGSKAAAGAGYGNSHGRLDNQTIRTTGTKAAASGSYQNRDSSLSQEQRETKAAAEQERGEKLSNTYNSDGERMTKSEFRAYQNELKSSDIQGMRRIMISPDPTLSITEQEMVSITRDAMWAWAETSGKQFGFSFAVHDGQSVMHSHVLMSAENPNDINMASKQLETFKGLVDEAIETQLDQREQLDENLDQVEELKEKENQAQEEENSEEQQSVEIEGGEEKIAEAEAIKAEEAMMIL